MKAIEGLYGFEFASEFCDRLENDCLIDSEYRDESPVMGSFLGKSSAEVHPVTVGQPHRMVLPELDKLPDIQEQTGRGS